MAEEILVGPKVIYEVNLQIDADIVDEYVAWLVPHMQEMLTLPGFTSCQLADTVDLSQGCVGAPDPGRSVHMTATYLLESREKLQEYFDVHAKRLRGDGTSRFTGKFSATRRIHTLRAAVTS